MTHISFIHDSYMIAENYTSYIYKYIYSSACIVSLTQNGTDRATRQTGRRYTFQQQKITPFLSPSFSLPRSLHLSSSLSLFYSLSFTLSLSLSLSLRTIPLVPGGEKTVVKDSNKKKYLTLLARHRLGLVAQPWDHQARYVCVCVYVYICMYLYICICM